MGSTLTPAEKRFLWDLIQTYLPREELSTEGGIVMQELVEFEMTWSERFEALGEAKGQRDVILRQLEVRFGPLPEEVRAQVQAITERERLARLSEELLTAASLDELDLGGAAD